MFYLYRKLSDLLYRTDVKRGGALKYVDPSFREDKEVVGLAAKQDKNSLYYASDSLQFNIKFILGIVSHNGLALQSVIFSLKENLMIVIAAISNNRKAFNLALFSIRKYIKE